MQNLVYLMMKIIGNAFSKTVAFGCVAREKATIKQMLEISRLLCLDNKCYHLSPLPLPQPLFPQNRTLGSAYSCGLDLLI